MKKIYITVLLCCFSVVSIAQQGVLFDQDGITIGYQIVKHHSFQCEDGNGNLTHQYLFNWYQIYFYVLNNSNRTVTFNYGPGFSINYSGRQAIHCIENPDYDYPYGGSGQLHGLGFHNPGFYNVYKLAPYSKWEGSVFDASTTTPGCSLNRFTYKFL